MEAIMNRTETLDSILLGKKALLVASTGGHLAQLVRLADGSPVRDDSLWISFDTPQSRSLLAGRRTLFIDYIPPRGWREVVSGSRHIRGAMRSERFEVIVSTGAGIALASHLRAAIAGLKPVYIESVSRVQGPSLTGRVLERVPGINRFSQHQWGEVRRGWRHEFSVLDTFAPRPASTEGSEGRPQRIFVTLGTIHPYEFPSLVRETEMALGDSVEVVWQLGCTQYRPGHGEVHSQMSAREFDDAVQWADTVVTHAGVGTLISLVEAGADVIAVPRRAARGEHVDDHQLQIAHEFAERSLVRTVEVDDLGRLLNAEVVKSS
jgi:UDP-N-acetylglucosamine--N-acetylmuramyl-(pentapeptide) pyrophosphoryl-undecaprenol N-acetylglucosamine transferase